MEYYYFYYYAYYYYIFHRVFQMGLIHIGDVVCLVIITNVVKV
jgi:hypothetical protein